MRTLVIFHGSCLDGFTAAWAARKSILETTQDEPEMFAAYYPANSSTEDAVLPDVTDRNVIMVDFCVHRGQLLRLKEQAKSLLVLDHHKTHRDACEGLDFCTFDMGRSGAALAFDYFQPRMEGAAVHTQIGGRPWLVSYVQDRDLWRWDLPDSKIVSAFLLCQEMTWENWDRIAGLNLEQVVRLGYGADMALRFAAGEAAKAARRIPFPMNVEATRLVYEGSASASHYYDDIPVVNMSYYGTSEAVGMLAQDAPFAVGWYQQADGSYRYSLRSRNGFDVSKVAEAFGGGGHAAAAGFSSKTRVHG